MPQGWGLEDFQAGNEAPYAEVFRVRDRAQADNIRWILHREGPDSRILVFAANSHTIAGPMHRGDEEPPVVAGRYLERWLGDDYFPIGNTVRSGSFSCGTARPMPDMGASSITTALGDIPHDAFLLDLSAAEGPVGAWLDGERELFPGALVHVSRAFEALIHMNEVTPACP